MELARYRRHLPFVIALVMIQVFLPLLSRAFYRLIHRPALLRAGALQCSGYVAQIPAEVPSDCDLVVVKRDGHRTEETFFTKKGDARTAVVTLDGAFLHARTVHVVNGAYFILPFLSVGAFLVATVHKMIRTGAIFNWQLGKFGADDFEFTMYLYAVPVFVAGFIGQFALH